jgi:hypothetical protein
VAPKGAPASAASTFIPTAGTSTVEDQLLAFEQDEPALKRRSTTQKQADRHQTHSHRGNNEMSQVLDVLRETSQAVIASQESERELLRSVVQGLMATPAAPPAWSAPSNTTGPSMMPPPFSAPPLMPQTTGGSQRALAAAAAAHGATASSSARAMSASKRGRSIAIQDDDDENSQESN